MRRREPVHFKENYSLVRANKRRRSSSRLFFCLAFPTLLAAQPQSPINELLDDAEAAELRGHLIYPASGSAMSIYHDVLFLDEDNTDALEGLIRLAEHYLEAAQAAMDENHLIKADSLVSKARMIYPQYPAIETMSQKIDLLESAERTRETLDWRLVAERSQRLTTQLTRLGSLAKKDNCRALINVSNDSEGRWVYQIMNQATGARRLRAEVRIASPAAVEIICFEHSDRAG